MSEFCCLFSELPTLGICFLQSWYELLAYHRHGALPRVHGNMHVTAHYEIFRTETATRAGSIYIPLTVTQKFSSKLVFASTSSNSHVAQCLLHLLHTWQRLLLTRHLPLSCPSLLFKRTSRPVLEEKPLRTWPPITFRACSHLAQLTTSSMVNTLTPGQRCSKSLTGIRVRLSKFSVFIVSHSLRPRREPHPGIRRKELHDT